MRSLHLFAGAGGGLLADLILGHTPIGAVENNAYCCDVLRARRDDGWFPGLRVHEQDIRLFDPSEYAGRVDLVAGGFPCVDISVAGKGAGITGERSGLWSEFARIIGDVRPRFVFVENSPALVTRGLDTVLSDLAALGFDAVWSVISADQAGAPHLRERIWILAKQRTYPAWEPCSCCDEFWCNVHDCHAFECDCPPIDEWTSDPYADPVCDGLQDCITGGTTASPAWRPIPGDYSGGWEDQPGICRVADGVAHRVDRLKALGNGQVPLQAALAWRLLSSRL